MSEDFELSENPETPASSSKTLSLKNLHAALGEQGVEIGYTTLSEFLKTEEVAALLKAGGTGNRREFLPEVVSILAAFLPEFRAAGGKMPQAPAMLRSFVKQPNSDLVPVGRQGSQLRETVKEDGEPADAVAMAEAQGRAQGLAMADQVLTAQEAADVLKVTPAMLRRSIPAWRRFGNSPRGDRWRLSDLLAGPRSISNAQDLEETPKKRPFARAGFVRHLFPGGVDALLDVDISEEIALMNGEEDATAAG